MHKRKCAWGSARTPEKRDITGEGCNLDINGGCVRGKGSIFPFFSMT